MDDNVTVLPKLSNRFKQQPKNVYFSDEIHTDPDVKSILKSTSQNDLDVLNIPHTPTKEEAYSIKDNKEITVNKDGKSSWTWVIIALSVIVVILVVVVAWYVLRENKEEPLNPIPHHIIKPNSYHLNHNYNNLTDHPMHPNNRPQSEQLPIQIKSMHPKNNKQPTKVELEETLKKLESIKEETMEPDNVKSVKLVKPSIPVQKLIKPRINQNIVNSNNSNNSNNTNNTQEENSSENSELDDNLCKKFYSKLQQNIDLDKAESDEEEGRDSND